MVDHQLNGVNAEIMRLRAELALDVDTTPQDDFDAFLEGSNQLTPNALRAAEQQYRQAEDDDEERDYLSFLKTSGQVPAEHPPEEDFEDFLETTNQLTPRALRAAEREYKASEAAEEERDYLSFLKTSGQVPAEHPPKEDFEDFLETTNQLTPRALRAAEREYKASEAAEEEEDFAQFLSETGQVAVPPSNAPLDGEPTAGDEASAALRKVAADIAALKAELGLEDTPQDDFDAFLEGSNQLTPNALRAAEQQYRQAEDDDEERDYLSFLKTSGQVPAEHPPEEDFEDFLETTNQLTPRALRAAEREYRQAEDDDEERDYLSFLKTSGQVPAEHPPEEDFEDFLETTNQLTPRALRAAEREYKASEAAEEEEDFAQFLSETGQIRYPPPGAGSIEDVLSSAEQDILRLRQELGVGESSAQGSVNGWGAQAQRL